MLALACMLALPAQAASTTLERIRSRGAIVMGYIEDGVPFSSLGADGTPQGYAVDLCREIAAGVAAQLQLPKLETRWVALTVQDRLDAIRAGRVDIECSTTTWTLTRQSSVDFSLIVFVDGGNILIRDGVAPRRLADFGGKRIAVIEGTTTDKALRDALAQRGIGAEVVTVQSRMEGLELLDASKVDGFASDRTPLIGIVESSATRSRFRLLDEDFSVEQYAFALARGDHDFRLAVNRVLARLYRSGDIMRIYNQSLGALGPPSLLLSATYFIQSLAE
ncbi:MAG: amino acid ABC transporter substrate-binding protein [Burkholderiales bacterium]